MGMVEEPERRILVGDEGAKKGRLPGLVGDGNFPGRADGGDGGGDWSPSRARGGDMGTIVEVDGGWIRGEKAWPLFGVECPSSDEVGRAILRVCSDTRLGVLEEVVLVILVGRERLRISIVIGVPVLLVLKGLSANFDGVAP